MEINYDLNLLRTFVMTCETQNLKRAGLRLGISESAISKHFGAVVFNVEHHVFPDAPLQKRLQTLIRQTITTI